MKGFSLIELLITLMIVAILTTLAYPLYAHHLAKARRHQAKIALLHLANQLEAYRSIYGSYQGASLSSLGIESLIKNHLYRLKILNATESQFEIVAIPLGSQARNDSNCGILRLDETGNITCAYST